MRQSPSRILLFSSLALAPALAFAQTTAVVTGVVTDPSGAVIPGAVVTLSNPTTGVKYTVKTNSAGSYILPNVPPGPHYDLEFEYQGFAPYEVKDIYVNVANSRTENAKLAPGQQVEVKVNADAQGVTLNTTDASIGNNFQVEKLQDLPVYDRSSPSVLFTLQPGITSSGATTGARTDQTDTTVDGLDVNDFATGSFQSITANAPVDAMQEFRGTTAGFTADNGPGGGGQFQLVTKSGTNNWHGDANEYHRDNSTTANNWFNNDVGVGQPKLVQNQFGGAVGGPILHDKAFFFFNYLGSRIAQDQAVDRTVPIASYRAGNVGYLNNDPGCTDSARQNTDPGCISYLSPTQVQNSDPAGIGESPQIFSVFQNVYPAANDNTGGDGINTASYRFNSPTPDNASNYTGKLDWVWNDHIRFYGVATVTRENEVLSPAQFPGDPAAEQFVDRSYRYAVGMSWQISPKMFNDLAVGDVTQDYDFARPSNPEGIYQWSFSTGFSTLIDSPYASPSNSQARKTPIYQINDNYTWTLGRHTLQIGGYLKYIHYTGFTQQGYDSYGIGLGGYVFGLGSALEPANLLPSDDTAQVDFDTAYAAALGRVASLSTTFNYDANGNVLAQPSSATRKFVYWQTQPYVGDTWKVTPHLTASYGLNYQYFTVPYETQGLETVQNTGFDAYFNQRLAQSAAGQYGNNALPFITYYLGGPKNNGPSIYHANPLDFAPHVAFAYNPGFDPKTVFNASAGIVYDRTVINAVQFQQTQYSYLFQQNNTTNYGNASNASASLAGDPRLASAPTAVAPATPKAPFQPYVTAAGVPYGLLEGTFNEMIDPHLKTPYSVLVNTGMQHQFGGNTLLKINYVGRFGRRLLAQADASQLVDFKDSASGQMMSAAFAAIETALRNGADPSTLPAQPWFENQLPTTVRTSDSSHGAFGNNTQYVAYENQSLLEKGDMADTVYALAQAGLQPNVGMAAQFSENTVYTNKGFSAYNGLLVTLQRNLSNGLSFDINYTFAHSIDNVSLAASGIAFGGYGFFCDAAHPKECRGNSDFDTTHYITSDFTYQLPYGRGRTFGAHAPLLLDEILGGWDVSGIPSWHSGQAWSPLSNAFVAGFANDAPAIFNGDKGVVKRHINKTSSGAVYVFNNPAAAAAAFSGPVGLTIGSRNILRGPDYFNMDAGLAKNFVLYEPKGVHMQLRADAFNVLNHPNFDDLDYSNYSGNTNITTPSSFGQLTAMANNGVQGQPGGPRVVQISARVEF